MNLGVITREEWKQRYASRVQARTGWTLDQCAFVASTGASVHEKNERACGNAIVWWGGPSGANNTPEDEADEEMSYWTKDEGSK